MNRPLLLFSIFILLILGNSTVISSKTTTDYSQRLQPPLQRNFLEKISSWKTLAVSPGEIRSISVSNPYPTLGNPVQLTLTIQGNPTGTPFEEHINLTDYYNGFILTANSSYWKSGTIVIDQFTITIGRRQTYTKTLLWYPVIVGNHTLTVKAGVFMEKNISLSVSFDTEQIILPSFGRPSIVIKEKSSSLTILVSEERKRGENQSALQYLQLTNITSSTSYTIVNETSLFTTWVATSDATAEDELAVWYDLQTIPAGLYNISVTTQRQTFSWPHAVRIMDREPTTCTIVQLTDTHVDKAYNLISEHQILGDIIQALNTRVHPDFVMISGDLVDWCSIKENRNYWKILQDALLQCDSPVFTTPGNHDRYEHGVTGLYYPYTNLTFYHQYMNPLDDYTLEYSGINFVFLDSGYDYRRWELELTPEATGLTTTQMYLLNHEWGNPTMNQIIVMHHPAVNEKNDTSIIRTPNTLPSGNDECIAFNRPAFLEYCTNNSVNLVLTGQTHTNRVLTLTGENATTPFAWPLFIQTASATLARGQQGGRILTLVNGTVQSYNYSVMIP